MTLTNPTDEQLDAAFATEVAGWTEHRQMILDKHFITRWAAPGTPLGFNVLALSTEPPKFTPSMDAVLPWLEKWRSIEIDWHRGPELWSVGIGEFKGDPTFSTLLPRACVIALLRAHGVEVIFR